MKDQYVSWWLDTVIVACVVIGTLAVAAVIVGAAMRMGGCS